MVGRWGSSGPVCSATWRLAGVLKLWSTGEDAHVSAFPPPLQPVPGRELLLPFPIADTLSLKRFPGRRPLVTALAGWLVRCDRPLLHVRIRTSEWFLTRTFGTFGPHHALPRKFSSEVLQFCSSSENQRFSVCSGGTTTNKIKRNTDQSKYPKATMTDNNIRVGESSSGASPSSKQHMLSGAECDVPTEILKIRSSSSSATFSTSDDSSTQYSSSYANDLDSVTRGMASMGGATILPAADDDDAAAASPAASSAATSSGGRPKMLHAKSYSELKWTEAPLEAPTDLAESFHEAIDAGNDATSPPKRLPLEAATTALLVVDVQPQYWSECASVRQDFPHFPQKLAQTIKTCRQRGAKLIFVRADYRYSHSPWLAQFERLHGGRPDMRAEVPCDPNDDEFAWEDFATPGK